MSKAVPPQLGAESFSCPHCGAFAEQYWLRVLVKSLRRHTKPVIITTQDLQDFDLSKIGDKEKLVEVKAWIKRLEKHFVSYETHEYGESCNWELNNAFVSLCHSCDGFAIWIGDGLIYPPHTASVERHEEMPDAIREDFEEAAAIVDRSPRGAAALLRLAIQKLMPILGEKGTNINDDIAALVKKGLDADIQRAMDIMRVVGNNAVHPGQIDLKDDKAMALKLFELVNLIIERRIATPKRIEELFMGLPQPALKAIEKRDGIEDADVG